MGGKKWCEYCHINIDYNKQAIQAHEETRMHIQNKERQIKYERHKVRKQAKEQARRLREQLRKNPQKKNLLNNKTINGIPASSEVSRPPKPKISEQKLEELRKYKEEVKSFAQSRIHSLIAQKTNGLFGAPVQFPEVQSSLLLVKQTYHQRPNVRPPASRSEQEDDDEQKQQNSEAGSDSDDSSEDLRMWQIQICPETQKPSFLNIITGARKYEKPTGFILTAEQNLLWEQLLKEHQEKPDPEEVVNIGQWEEVADEENIFLRNAASDSEQEQNQKKEPVVPKPLSKEEQRLKEIEEMVAKGQITTTNQVLDAMVKTAVQSSESIRDRNEKLKQLLHNNFQKTATMDMNNADEGLPEKKIAPRGFQARKKPTKNVILTTEDDIF